jgi:thaumarchaeosortase
MLKVKHSGRPALRSRLIRKPGEKTEQRMAHNTMNDDKGPRRTLKFVMFFLVLLSFIVAFGILYFQYPESFEMTWKGRTYYLFFLWLFILEGILSWEQLQPNMVRLKSLRTLIIGITFVLPALYVVVANYCGLNAVFESIAKQYNAGLWSWMPLSTEYLVLTALFALSIFLIYGIKALDDFAITTVFLGLMGLIYTIDNLYPYGKFTPFQIIVPTTASLATWVLRMMGYHTLFLGDPSGMPTYIAWDKYNNYSGAFSIAWPCSGVESLVIYAIVILLFLKKSNISLYVRGIYFAVGAVITYFINALRIATIFIISINGGNVTQFHNYYGQLYSISWIIVYPLIIIGVGNLSRKLGFERRAQKKFQALKRVIVKPKKPQPFQPNAA